MFHWVKVPIKNKNQAQKGIRGMPWYLEAMKGVLHCDKRRGDVKNLRSVDARMGEPTACAVSLTEYIG